MGKVGITEIGQKTFWADDNILAGKLIYLQGIEKFDAELKDKYQNECNYVIHLAIYPKGFLIKLAKNFSAVSFGLSFEQISRIKLIRMTEYSFLILETEENVLHFGILNEHISDLKEFIKSAKHNLKIENPSKLESDVDAKFRKYLLKYTDIFRIDTSKILSSKWKRFLNNVIDSILIFVVIFCVLSLSPNSVNEPITLTLISIISFTAYYLFFEGFFKTTAGKMVTNSRVVCTDGTKADSTRIFARTISRLIPLDPMSFLFDKNPGWHDSISKTAVIDNDKRKGV
jgi:uncharacterized RDD family membrane protein YckC